MTNSAMETAFSVSVKMPVVEAIEKVQESLANHKFSVLWHLDMQAKLREKGLDLGREVHILEVCNAPRAKQALEISINTAYLLPCKVVVYSEDGMTRVGMVKPGALVSLMQDDRLTEFANEVQEVLESALRALA